MRGDLERSGVIRRVVISKFAFNAGAMAERRKRRPISLKQKFAIVEAVQSGRKQASVAKEYGLPSSTVASIVKERNRIKELVEQSDVSLERKHMRLGKYHLIDEAVCEWYKEETAKNLNATPITGPMIKAKAKEFARDLQVSNFIASSGWLYRFQERYGKSFSLKKNMDTSAANFIREGNLSESLAQQDLENVFVADEIPFFFKLLPNHTLAIKGEQCPHGERSKERLSVLLCSNVTGTTKLRPLVVGKSADSRCLRSVASLPCDYRYNSPAWMTQQIFFEWAEGLNGTMKKANRQIVLVVRSCSIHVVSQSFSNVSIKLLQANSSTTHPFDHGITRDVKAHFRRRLVDKAVACYSNKIRVNMDIAQAMEMIAIAWNELSSTTIRNCWTRAGYEPIKSVQRIENSEDSEETRVDILPDTWIKAKRVLNIPTSVTFDDYVLCDQGIKTSSDWTCNGLVETLCATDASAVSSDEGDEDDQLEEAHVVSYPAVAYSINTLRKFISQQPAVPMKIYSMLSKIEDFLTRSATLCENE